jgi:hypothetical protein
MKQIEISKIINLWFEDVKQQVSEKSVNNKTLSFSLCSVSLPVMQIYCSASGFLLDNDYNLPATALFRIMSDIFIKFLWCLNTDNEDETRKRMYRWEKTSAKEKLRLLDNLLKSSRVLEPSDVNKLNEFKIKVEQDDENNPHKAMPAVTGKGGIFEQTSNVFGADVSALLYRQYCSAVHIDTSIFRGLMNNKQGNLIIRGDIDEDVNELKKRCLNFVYMYFVILNRKTSIDITTIKEDYENAIGILNNPKT